MLTGNLKTSRLLVPGLPFVCYVTPQCHPVCLQPVCLYHPLSLSVYLSFSQEEKGISCELVDLDFLRCSVGFPFMRAQTKVALTEIKL